MNPKQTLLQVPSGKTVRVHALHADGPLRTRLFSMGITPGTSVEICPGCGCEGARRIRVRDASLVLGEYAGDF